MIRLSYVSKTDTTNSIGIAHQGYKKKSGEYLCGRSTDDLKLIHVGHDIEAQHFA
jgi:hypothetical protein